MNTHQEIKISHGVYVTDFRKQGELKGISTDPVQPEIKDLGLLLDKIMTNQSKITQLLFSNEAMQQQQNWEQEPEFVEAIEQNYEIMLRFSMEMKEWVVQLYAVNYKPENEKMEKLTNADRIEKREQELIVKGKQIFLEKVGISGVKESNDDGDEDGDSKKLVEVNDEPKEKEVVDEEEDKGVYL